MKHRQWNFKHQPVDEWYYFGQRVIQVLLKSNLVGVLCVLSGCQANSGCCFCTPLSAWTRSSKSRECGGEGIRHVVFSLILFLSHFFLDLFPLSHSLSLSLFWQLLLSPPLSIILSLSLFLPRSLFISLCFNLSSSLTFFCSCSKEIIISGFSTKLSCGHFKDYLSHLLVLITANRYTQLAPFLFQ